MSRRTYSERRAYSAKVMRFRLAVYMPREISVDATTGELIKDSDGDPTTEVLTNGCRLLLLRLSDDMDAAGKVSIPRSVLAADLGVAKARITEWIAKAKRFGFLSSVRRGRPGVTAVYACMVPPLEVRQGVPSQRYARADHAQVLPGVPSSGPQRYATAVPQEEVARARIGTVDGTSGPRRGSYEKHEPSTLASRLTDCEWHPHSRCPFDCANHPTAREESA